MARVSVCMCTLNEEKAIKSVISAIRLSSPAAEIIIVDSSSDDTPQIAEKLGATVILRPKRGYGVALREALIAATGEILITMDCDGTYPPKAIPDIISKLDSGKFDVVSCSRFKSGRPAAMPALNQFGNRLFAAMTSLLYGFECTDITTGMRGFRREVIHSFDWTENVGLSLELLFKPAAAGYRICEISIPYNPRLGEVKLNPLSGGLEMIKTILKYRLLPIKKKQAA